MAKRRLKRIKRDEPSDSDDAIIDALQGASEIYVLFVNDYGKIGTAHWANSQKKRKRCDETIGRLTDLLGQIIEGV